jgi:hypothetical protein
MSRPLLILSLLAQPVLSQTAPGLLARFADGSHSIELSVPTPNFHLDAGESVHPQLLPAFTADFTGELSVLEAGDYRFEPAVEIDGRPGTAFKLNAGRHALRVRFTRSAQSSSLQLRWMSARFPWEPVPGSAFTHRPAANPSEQGRRLVERDGCANCHSGSPSLRRPSVSLDGIGSRVKAAWIEDMLDRHFMALDGRQRADTAAFLASRKAAREAPARRASEVDVGKGGELFSAMGCAACHALSGLGSKYVSLGALAEWIRDRHVPSMLLDEGDATAIASHLMRSEVPLRPASEGDISRGRVIAEGMPCTGCHAGAGSSAKPLSELEAAECRVTRFSFSAAERTAVQAFLAGYRAHPDRSPAPVYQVRRLMAGQRCIACHRYESAGPTATLLEAVPVLTGVGMKLKTSWIGRVLSGSARVRTGHEIRMPHYPEAMAGEWPAWLAKADGVAPGNGDAPPVATGEQRTRGHGFLGAMACIGCHDWGKHKALGEEGPDLITAGERMRFEWYERWMRNPGRILSGTSMPPVTNPERSRLLWAAMEAGPKLPVPEGYTTAASALGSEAKPVPGKKAIIIRWDMPEATPAAIAVGLPGGMLSYCFDAGAGYLRYAWRGGFLDMSGTLLRKTDASKLTPTAGLLGEVFYRSAGPPIRVGDQRRIPGFRFRGYRLTGGVPEFRYELDGVEVRETLTVLGNGIHRVLVFAKVDGPVWFEGRAVPTGVNVKVEADLP